MGSNMQQLAFVAAQHLELRRRIQLEDPTIDGDTLADTVEGLTNLYEIIAAVIRSALLDEALASGLKQRIEQMEERQRRLDDRAAKRREMVREAMVQNGIRKIIDPEFTLSLRAGTFSLVVVDESAIPSRFWEARAPRLNKQGLLSELKQGADIAGVALSNPERVLSVRTK